jgi:glycine/D-amino acid oxidase-like deaminating enzyme
MGRETGEETRSIWMATPLPRFAALDGNRQVDVAVIGAGITGITTAWLLKRQGRRVAVIEAAEVGSGESSRTSAHLTAVLDGGLSRLVSRFGGDNAIVAVRAHQAAIDWIDSTARTLGIDCDFRRVPGFLYCDDEICRPDGENGRALLDAELEAAHALGMEARRVPGAPLPFATGPALRFENQAQFHPRRYLRGLVDALVSDGSVVFERTRVLSGWLPTCRSSTSCSCTPSSSRCAATCWRSRPGSPTPTRSSGTWPRPTTTGEASASTGRI